MRFRAEVKATGGTTTGIEVPHDVVASLGGGKRPPVLVTIGSYTYPTSVATMGGLYLVPVSAEVRTRAGVAAGDAVDIDINIDTRPREVQAPPDLAAALAADPDAARCFEGLSYSKKKQVVLPIESAKTDETRRRRLERALIGLREGRT